MCNLTHVNKNLPKTVHEIINMERPKVGVSLLDLYLRCPTGWCNCEFFRKQIFAKRCAPSFAKSAMADSQSHSFPWSELNEWLFFFQFNQAKNLGVILDYFLQLTAVFLALPAEDIQNPTTSHHLLVFPYSEPTVSLPHDPFSPPTDLPASNFAPHGLFPTCQLEQLSPQAAHVPLLPRPFSGTPFQERSTAKVCRRSLTASTISSRCSPPLPISTSHN